MKKIIRRLIILGIILSVLTIGSFWGVNNYLMPSLVAADELVLPNIVGMNKFDAIRTLESLNLTPIEIGPRYDANFKIDEVIFQKPYGGTKVKVNRRVYIHICGGEPLIKMPQIVGKTFRDAKVNIERIGLFVKKVNEVRSEFPKGTVVEQEFPFETELQNGDSVSLKISIGPQLGMVRVPNIIAKSEKEAVKILHKLSLKLGNKSYITSPTLLPNTIVSQTPAQNFLVSIGDSVDVVISKSSR